MPSPTAENLPPTVALELRAIAGSPPGLLLPDNELDYGALPPAASLPPTAGLALSLPSPFGWTLDPLAGIAADDAVAAGDAGSDAEVSVAAVPLRHAVPGSLHADCGWAAKTLQAGGEYWNTLPYGAMPTRLSPTSPLSASLADPIRGPSGDRSNLPPPGPAGAWCRPPPVPIADTSPLSNSSFWIPATLVLFGFGVFWLSRGLALPP